jgi:GMP synthase (glutamine-hydrolysing)
VTPPRLLVIQHDLDDALNELAAPLADAGLIIDTWCTFRSDAPEEPLESFDGVLSLGALASATDEDATPWIRGEIAVLEQALARRMPILGVCFGAQLLARAAGGRVYRSPVTEIGWFEVDMAPEAAADPVLGSLGPNVHVFQSHYDTFDLPAEATVLGRTGELTEAYRIGDRAWGVQFHIEANPSLVYSWLAVYKDAMLKAGVDIDELRRFTASYWREYRQASWDLATAFAGEVWAAKA